MTSARATRRDRRRRQTEPQGDHAQIMVLEATLATMIFIGAASFVSLAASDDAAREREIVGPAASDALTALLTLADRDGRPLADVLIRDAWRCVEEDGSPACNSPAHAAAASRLRAYLAPGSSYELTARGASAPIQIGPAATNNGPSAGATAVYVPTWSYAIVAPTVSCRDPGTSARAEIIVLQNGNPGLARRVELEEGSVTAARNGDLWSATTVPSGSSIKAEATTRTGSVLAEAPIGSCQVAGHAARLSAGIAESTFAVVPVDGEAILAGGPLQVRHDLAPAAGLATLRNVSLEIYAPASNGSPMWTIPLGSALTGASSWSFPATALEGCYATQLRATWLAGDDAASEEVATRRLGATCVALPSGHVPPVPMYRMSLRVWMPEWSG